MSDERYTLRLERREDGGLHLSCDELPGLYLSHSDPALVLADVWPAIVTMRDWKPA